MIFIPIFLALYATTIQAEFQFAVIKLNEYINHGKEAVIWFLTFCVFTGLYFLGWVYENHPMTANDISFLAATPAARWIIHDYTLNKLRSLPYWYTGKGAKSSWNDRILNWIFQRVGVDFFYPVKFSFMVICFFAAKIILKLIWPHL